MSGIDEFAQSDGEGRRRWLRAPGGKASRLEVYVLAAIVLVLGFGSVGGAIVIAASDSPPQPAAARAQMVEETTTTTAAAPVATAPPTTEAPPPPTTAAPARSNPWTGDYVETYVPPPATVPPTTVPGPSGRPCTVPDLVGVPPAAGLGNYSTIQGRISASGCRLPVYTHCLDPSLGDRAGVRSQNPAPGTVIDSNAFWYATSSGGPTSSATGAPPYFFVDKPPC